jgi:tetratricopeptide (TPR) repeat protein
MNVMNRFFLFFIFFFSFVKGVYGQNTVIDSLKNELKIHKEKDTTRVNLLYDLAFSSFQTDMISTKTYLKEAEDLSANLNYTRGKAKVYYLKGMLENMKSNYLESLNYFERSLKYYESVKDRDRTASVYIAFGINYYDLSQYEEALVNYKKAIQIYQDLGNKREVITSLINVGNVYSELGRYDESISNYKKALKMCKEIKDEDGVSFVYGNLGVVYKVQGNYPLAVENYNKSLAFNKKIKDTLSVAFLLNNLGEVYSLMGKDDKALAYHNQSLQFSIAKESKNNVATNNSNIGKIYMHKKDYEKALIYYRISLDTSLEINNLKQTSICYNNIGGIYLLLKKPLIALENFIKAKTISQEIDSKQVLSSSFLGIAESYLNQEKYKEALINALKAKKIASEHKLLVQRKDAQKLLSVIYENNGDFEKALKSHQQFKILNDSLFNKEKIEKIAALEYEYKYKKEIDSAKERETKLNETVQTTTQDLEKSQRNLLLGIITFLAVAIILGSVIFYLKLRSSRAITQNIITEQKLLRTQMTPHFIFNSLSVLQGMILNKEESKSVSYLSKFSKLLRITLENSRDKTVLLSQELEAVDHYLLLQNIENEKINFKLEVDQSIQPNKIKVPPMLIQPFVENAIEHAFKNQKETCKIEIYLVLIDSKLTCTILDNGMGIDSSERNKNKNKKSLATKITSERLQYLSKDFKMDGSITIEDRNKYNEQGTKVTIQIPFLKLEA